MRLFKALLALAIVWPIGAGANPEVIEQYSLAIVHTVADIGGNEVHGTGFFIDDVGHILTAGHNVLPAVSALGGTPTPSNDVKVTLYLPNAPTSAQRTVKAVVIYADPQVDIALLRAAVPRSIDLDLAPVGTLRDHVRTGIMTWRADDLGGPGRPVFREATIDSVFNPNNYHDGLIDISGTDLGASSSGGPLLDELGYVAGIFVKGRRSEGEAVVPISFAAGMLHMAGVSYPSDEVREVINELKKELFNWSIEFQEGSGNVVLKFNKRLAAGASPVKYFVTFRVFTKRRTAYAFERQVEHAQDPIGGKDGLVNLVGVGAILDEEIERRNRHAEAENRRQDILRDKDYAEVKVVVGYSDDSLFTEIVDHRMDFD